MKRDDIIERWRANAAAAGVRLTDDDIRRIEQGGHLAQVEAFEQAVARIDGVSEVPDYLHLLSGNEARRD